ncbi:hypothetical protein EST38_g7460 [Candolleomyces aberdarensis]|uniref:Uncharacterized protein n=1 Tax=Candolleomyces aberdarensis TaxID=2316362 RepID=A0A4Q2DF66_9AGAR|nr:hypothetical protein EST38_g7460 [Candolleomyces aberdarensis]
MRFTIVSAGLLALTLLTSQAALARPVDSLFSVGQKVDVHGVSIGKGYAGTIKRHNFGGTHSAGSTRNGQDSGKVSPGQTGGTQGGTAKGK